MKIKFSFAVVVGELLSIIQTAATIAHRLSDRPTKIDMIDHERKKLEHALNDIAFRIVRIRRKLPTNGETFITLVPYGDQVGILFGPIKGDYSEGGINGKVQPDGQ